MAGPWAWAAAVNLHVAPGGGPTATGAADAPFASLAQARDALRELRRQVVGQLPGPATVWVHGGVYELTETSELTAADGGQAATPVTYRAVPGEIPVPSGGPRAQG